jgi:type IV pilus assembly protein PilW
MELKRKKRMNTPGFTMVELLVAMAISLLAMAAIYSTFLTQQKSYRVQGEVAAMQQNLRAAMFYMQREIRMAGCDPYNSGGIGFITANSNLIRFTEDVVGNTPGSPPDGDTDDSNEDITYNLVDSDGDGDNDLVRKGQLVAQNIDALNFVYLDADGNTTTTLNDIRSVQITIVAKTGRNTLAAKNNVVYYNQQGTTILGAQNDNFSRRRLTTVIKCRNLGL